MIVTPTTPYVAFVVPFVLSGIGMACFFVPVASLVLGLVPREDEGVAWGEQRLP